MRMKEMIIDKIFSWLINKFSLLAPKDLYKKQYGEYTD